MVGVSAIGICDENYEARKISELKLPAGYSDLEHLMLNAIINECRSCISSEGRDCYSVNLTACPFTEVRRTLGIEDIEIF